MESFNNIPNDENLHPDLGEKQLEDGMNHVKKDFENRLEIPIKYTPGHATFEDIDRHARVRQRLGPTTRIKNLRYARFMETYQPFPVNLREPDFENFMQHMDYREQNGTSEAALRHEWDSMKMFLRAYGIALWPYKPPKRSEPHLRMLPLPDTVYKFFTHRWSKKRYENALWRHLFKIGFTVGVRPPAELAAFTTSDIRINSDLTGGIIVTEVKKGNKKHPLLPRKQINKIFINWLDHWRPKVADQHSGDALFLWPSGKPVTTTKLGHEMSKHGKQIYLTYRNYDMRHWCGIARLIETFKEGKKWDEFTVCDWMGHDDPKTTMDYIKYAKMYYVQDPCNWMKRVLKFYKKDLINEESPLNRKQGQKPRFRVEPTDITRYGGTGPQEDQQKEKKPLKTQKNTITEFLPLTKTFYFFYIKMGRTDFKQIDSMFIILLSVSPPYQKNQTGKRAIWARFLIYQPFLLKIFPSPSSSPNFQSDDQKQIWSVFLGTLSASHLNPPSSIGNLSMFSFGLTVGRELPDVLTGPLLYLPPILKHGGDNYN